MILMVEKRNMLEEDGAQADRDIELEVAEDRPVRAREKDR